MPVTSQLGPRPGDDHADWTRRCFAAGDYAGAAMFGDPRTWEQAASLAMLRGRPTDFAALRQHHHPSARLHLAAACFIHGDDAGASAALVGLSDPHAVNFARLLAKPKLQVLTQLPWLPDQPTDLLGGARHDQRFELRNIGHGNDDFPNEPGLDVHSALADGYAPDFYLAMMVEWQQLPNNLQQLPCPRFGHIADHDLHIQTLAPWLPLFDELCVTDRSEWLDVQGLGQARTSSFPKVFGLPRDLPPLSAQPRRFDAFVSGTMLDPYHPDKAELLHGLLAAPDLDLRLINGFAGSYAFHAMLASSRASFTYVRRPGAMPTRGLESLAMGCAVALQEESVLNLYYGETDGIVTYGPSSGSLAAALQRIRRDWPSLGPAASQGAARVRAEFALEQIASQYLRFLTFRAAAPRPPQQHGITIANQQRPNQQRPSQQRPSQQRLCVSRTWLPTSPVVRRRCMQASFRQLGERFAQQPKPATLLAMARELLCEYAYYQERGDAGDEDRKLFDDAISLLERCVQLFPDRLVPRLVLIRAQLHLGAPAARSAALQLAHDTLLLPPQQWSVDPMEDVLPFDFHGEFFHYRAYLDLAAAAAKGQAVPTAEYVRLIRASLAGYLARKTGRLDWHQQASELDPGFPRYRLDWATALLEAAEGNGEPTACRAQAASLLEGLTEGSGEFPSALQLLQRHAPASMTDARRRILRRLGEDTLDARRQVQQLFAHERRGVVAARRLLPQSTQSDTQFAVLVPVYGGRNELRTLLQELRGLDNARRGRAIVVLPTGQTTHPELAAAAGGMPARWIHVPANADYATCLNAAVAAADADLLTIAMPGDRFRPDSMTLLVDALQTQPDIGVVFGSDGWTEGVRTGFDPAACIAVQCALPAAEQRLLQTNAVGLHPMWRASLHHQYGGFAGEFGAAAEHEFWLRIAPHWRLLALPTLLCSSDLAASWRQLRDPAADPAGCGRALAVHGRGGVSAAGFVVRRPLPAQLLAPGIAEEATSHARLGLLTDRQRNELRMLELFHGTALLHNNIALAQVLLQAAAERTPHLLSPRLALASLLQATAQPGAAAVLRSALDCSPYRAFVMQRLAALDPGNIELGRDHQPKEELSHVGDE